MELAITVIIHSLKHSSRLQLLLLYGVQDYGVSISVVSTNLAFFSLVVGEPHPLRVQPQAQEDGSAPSSTANGATEHTAGSQQCLPTAVKE